MTSLANTLSLIVPMRNLHSPEDDAENPAQCIPNINDEERRGRLRFGIIQMTLSLAILVVMVVTGISPFWRLLLFPMFAGAAVGYFQWRDRT